MFDTVSVPNAVILEKLNDSVRFSLGGSVYVVPHTELFDEIEDLTLGQPCDLEVFRRWAVRNGVDYVW